ncbi:unnamed protein product [Brassica rapa]|uniref:A20-type domain-containing protein n=1 Tax=Brassica campestris TaxID=3711 RepID=A0A8D9GR01_BRACM|nr:unnamed protein product [Brassica rapa]
METREIVPGIKSVSCGVTKLSVGEQVRPATIPITRSNHNFKLSAILCPFEKKKKKGTTMNSEQNNSTSFPPTEPELCDNRCGFFVSSNMNLCSRCYRILRAEEDLTAVAKSAVKNSLITPE